MRPIRGESWADLPTERLLFSIWCVAYTVLIGKVADCVKDIVEPQTTFVEQAASRTVATQQNLVAVEMCGTSSCKPCAKRTRSSPLREFADGL